MYNDTSSGIFLVMLIFCFYLKETMEKKDFASFVQVFKLLVWAPKIVKSCFIVK